MLGNSGWTSATRKKALAPTLRGNRRTIRVNIGMYGPPQICKRKLVMTFWSAPMYSASGGANDSGP